LFFFLYVQELNFAANASVWNACRSSRHFFAPFGPGERLCSFWSSLFTFSHPTFTFLQRLPLFVKKEQIRQISDDLRHFLWILVGSSLVHYWIGSSAPDPV